MGKTHVLKTVNPYFQDIWDGKKNFEIRFDDRCFEVGDILQLLEYQPDKNKYTGRRIDADVLYVMDDKPFVPTDYVCMSIRVFYRKP